MANLQLRMKTSGLQGKPFTSAVRTVTSAPSTQFLVKKQIRRVNAVPELASFVHHVHPTIAAMDIDWTDPDVQIGALGAFLGLALGIGTPIFYISRDVRDEERLEEIRALNRATKAETGEYMSQEELEAIRPPRWTDRREFVDDD